MPETSPNVGTPAPARRFRRRWLQFRLRSLLIVITLFCVGMGWWMERARGRHAAIESLQEHFATLTYTNAQEVAAPFGGEPVRRDWPGPAWLRNWLGEYAFTKVERVRVNGSLFGWVRDEESLRALRRLPELRELDLWQMQSLTDERLKLLSGLVELESLNLSGTSITNAGLAHLAGMQQLETLVLNGTDIDYEGLAHLRGLKSLRVLELNDTQLDDAGLAELAQLPALEELWLTNTDVTDAGLAKLMQQRKLKVLGLAGTLVEGSFLAEADLAALTEIDLRFTPVRSEVLSGLAAAPQLQSINLGGCWELSDEAVEKFAGKLPASTQLVWFPNRTLVEFPPSGGFGFPFGFPSVSSHRILARMEPLTNLREVDLFDWTIVDDDLVHLQGLEALETLTLSRTQITGEGLSHLTGLTQLKQLNLAHTPINDAALVHIIHFWALEELALTGTPITDTGLRRLDGLAYLKRLNLAATNVNGLAFVWLPCRELEVLDLRYTPLTEEGLGALNTYTKLKELSLTGCWELSKESLVSWEETVWSQRRMIVAWEPLETMTSFSGEDDADFGAGDSTAIPASRVFFALSHAWQLEDIEYWYGTIDIDDGQRLETMRQLRTLDLCECQFAPAALRQFPVCPHVTSLILSGTNVDDATIEALSRWRDLQELILLDTHITPAGAERLRRALPHCEIEHSYRDPDEPRLEFYGSLTPVVG